MQSAGLYMLQERAYAPPQSNCQKRSVLPEVSLFLSKCSLILFLSALFHNFRWMCNLNNQIQFVHLQNLEWGVFSFCNMEKHPAREKNIEDQKADEEKENTTE